MEENKRDLWGVIPPAKFPTHCGRETVQASGYKLDDKGETVYGKTSDRNIVKEINSPETKNLSGVNAARRLIASGQVSPNHFADDGKHGGVFPSEAAEPGTAWEAAQRAAAIYEKVKSDLAKEGLDFSGIASADDPNEYIASVIKARAEAKAAAQNGGESQ